MSMPASRRRSALRMLAIPGIIVVAGLIASAASRAADSSPAVSYPPSVSDLMIATIQPRHERLWQAQHQHNWEFAACELHNLHGAFDRLGHAHPTVEITSLPEMIASVTDQPFAELKSVIEAKEDAAFVKAYADLTDACNSCHQTLTHGAVVIAVPDGASSSDLTGDHVSAATISPSAGPGKQSPRSRPHLDGSAAGIRAA